MTNDEETDLAKRIADTRRRSSMSQKQLAEKLGVHWRTLQNWEAGTTTPSEEYLAQLTEVLGVSWNQAPPEISWDETDDLTDLEIAVVRLRRLHRDLGFLRSEVELILRTLDRPQPSRSKQ